MQLRMPVDLAADYRSPSQRARIITEAWGRSNLYCPGCDSATIEPSDANTRVVDFICPNCTSAYQLKSQSHAFSRRIVDSAYAPMRRAIEESKTPHFLILHYDRQTWRVRNLVLIPKFALTMSCLEKRRPLALNARRSGWVGCNILLFRIPIDARISLVHEGSSVDPTSVRSQFRKLRPLDRIPYDARGWTLDVLNVIRGFNKRHFRLIEIYEHSDDLQALHPGNLHVREKIRQQLQRLRDLGLVRFLGAGKYLSTP